MTSTHRSARAARKSLARRLDEADLGFDTSVLELRLARDAGNVALLSALAEAYTRQKRYADGLALDQQLVAHAPTEPVFRYNLACSLVLTGDLDGACDALLESFRLGYRDLEHMEQDADLRRLRKDARYAELLERLARITRDNGN